MWLCPFVVFMAVFFFIEEGITCDNGSGVAAGACNNSEFPGNGGYRLSFCFIIGAILSAAAGYAGMLVATDCNVKAAEAAKDEEQGLNKALTVAFAGGAVMGFTVVGLGLTGLTVLFMLFAQIWDHTETAAGMTARYNNVKESLNYMAGFSFGASAIALFARVAGGIYTKAADVGADLVGKVEAGFPEDSYYNPATIADNVGDNVGDVAGMGADLFESFVGSVVAAATLAMTSHSSKLAGVSDGMETFSPDYRRVALPFWVAGFGVVASMIGFFCVGTSATMEDKDQLQHSLLMALHRGIYSSAVLILGFSALAVWMLYSGDSCTSTLATSAPSTTLIPMTCDKTDLSNSGIGYNTEGFDSLDGWKDFGCLVIGLLTGILIGEATEYFTSYAHSPTRSITKSGVTGPATVIIQGLGIGMLSSVPPVIFIAGAVMACSALSGVYGAALAAVGMLSTLGITLATDAYGPVADNAGGVAEMAHLPEEVRATTDALDALGNTTAATGKGFAVGSAVLTALAFMNAFAEKVKPKVLGDLAYDHCKGTGDSGTSTGIFAGFSAAQCDNVNKYMTYAGFFDLTEPYVLSGLLIGAMLPFLFAALTMLSVGKAAQGIIVEVRRQLHETGKNGKRMLCLAKATMGENYD